MAVVSFPARNKLAFPAGRVPGFDPSHRAALGLNGLVFPRAGGTGINFAGRTGFAKATVGGSLSFKIDQYLGPAVLNGNPGNLSFTGPVLPTTATGTGYTLASFIKPTDVSTTNAFISVGDADLSGEGLYQGIIGGNFGARLNSVITFDSGIAPSNGIPYFYALSLIYQGSSVWDHNHVVLRLDTGQLTTSRTTGTSQAALSFTSGVFRYGGATAFGTPVNIGPAMTSTTVLNLQQLVAFANDPWALWYPTQTRSRVAAAAAATFLAGWAQQTNLPVLGTGTY